MCGEALAMAGSAPSWCHHFICTANEVQAFLSNDFLKYVPLGRNKLAKDPLVMLRYSGEFSILRYSVATQHNKKNPLEIMPAIHR